MAQWFAAKADHPDTMLFFRMGDFYELFFADAEAAAAVLDITLSHRGEHAGVPIPMCGVPRHAAESYLARLIRRGFRVAIVEQMEDPKARSGKLPIKREVVRIITPGTITEETLLDGARPNLLMALAFDPEGLGAAWLDVSTGSFETTHIAPAELPALLGRLEPVEILAPQSLDLADWRAFRSQELVPSTPLVARRRLAEAFSAADLDAFGTFTDGETIAAAMAIDYVRTTQAGVLPRLARPEPQGQTGVLLMDAATRTSLDILTARDGGTRHTVLGSVRHTVTAPGTRLLAAWLAAPLTDLAAVKDRQDAWSWCASNPDALSRLRMILKTAPDVARALGRLSVGRGTPRDLLSIRYGLCAAHEAAEVLTLPLPAALARARTALPSDTALADELARALTDPAPARLEDDRVIRPGFDGELDALRTLRDESRQVIARLQLDFAQRYGVASLKIRHHAQLGYVIEAPSVAVETLRANPDLTLRQVMANGARFTTPELSDLDRRIREAAELAATRERLVFDHLVKTVLDCAGALGACADAIAFLDVTQSAASLQASGRWIRPLLTDADDFLVEAGRHPVVESALAGTAAFVPNRGDLSSENRVMLLTGPNMAGKSTFLRQNALFVILAQAGLPVPAESAVIGIVDRLFSRVGAADDLARGRSTFMVEMTETAAILHQAGPRSFVVVDEIGRGTSTLDGLAIAWAVLEALHSATRCRTIFATHFHELAGLSERLPRLKLHTMRVKEWKGSVIFLHEVAEGVAGRSWGIHVAELAGIPPSVVRRAGSLLAAMEKQGGFGGRSTSVQSLPLFAAAISPPEPYDQQSCSLLDALNKLDVDNMSPKQAHDALYSLKALMRDCAS